MNKRIKWQEVGKKKSVRERVEARRKKAEQLTGKKLDSLGCFCLDPEKIEGRNIENMVGCVQVPVGVAGPLRIRNGKSDQEYYLPLATTEGALVGSVNRGCKVIGESGGAEVRVESVGATRGPVFKVKGLKEGKKLMDWVENNFEEMNKVVRKKERHLRLKKSRAAMVGKNVYLRLEFETDEAMGMNMVTIGTEEIVRLIKKRLEIDWAVVSGNYCVDKKPSWLNFIQGRGKKVWAEVRVLRETVEEILKTTPEKIVETVYRKQLLGSAVAGSIGFNGHYANIVGAVFLSTGQDVAHVGEGSLGVTTAEMEGDKLYFSVYLPDLMVGTVGGGTGLATQRECLEILDLGSKKGDSVRLAEIVGGAVLAGELSLTGALASGDLGKAHQTHGRGK